MVLTERPDCKADRDRYVAGYGEDSASRGSRWAAASCQAWAIQSLFGVSLFRQMRPPSLPLLIRPQKALLLQEDQKQQQQQQQFLSQHFGLLVSRLATIGRTRLSGRSLN
jgi:hypothetical protein